jgi:hypothetical protein
LALTVELLNRLLAALPPTEAALNFLKRSDLTQIVSTGERTSYSPAEHWLRIYKVRQGSTMKARIITYGFSSLLLALEKLHPQDPSPSLRSTQMNGWGSSGQIRPINS